MAKLLLGSVVGPQGPQGTPGVNGSQGPQGIPGPSEIAATTDVVGLTTGQLLYNNGGKVGSVEIVDNLLSVNPNKPLSANQGKVLKGLIDGNSSAIGQNSNKITQLSNPNLLINGDFQVWQRGTSFALNPTTIYSYTADRWWCSTNFSSATAEKDGEFAKLTAVTVGSGTDFNILQGFETVNVIPLRGKKVTFSVNLKKYANMTTGDIVLNVYTGTGIDQAAASTGRVVTTKKINYSELSETPKLFTLTADVPADTNSLCIIIRIGTIYGNQINNGGSFGVKYAKLELGEIATPFSPRSYAEELALCQRYYEEINVRPVSYSPQVNTVIEFPISIIEKRVLPTITLTAGGEVNINTRYVQARTNKIIEVGLNSAGVGQTYAIFLIKMDSEIY